MKKTLAIILAILMIVTTVPFAFAAEEYTEGNFIYTVENGEATIIRYAGHDKVVVIPDTLGGYPVTTIGDRAFYYFRSITEITIPDSVTTIGASAFESCESLTEITIPDSVTTIGASAFDTCKSLTEITIPGSVTTINDNTFDACESLTKITIPDSVTSIGRFAFNKCINLTEIIIPNSVISIAGYAFSECINLTEITIPNSVISIANYVFYKCTSLKEITIPHSVTQFGQYVFLECTALEKVNVPCTWNHSLSVDATVTLNKVHDIIIDDAVAPKCGETGLTQGEYCTRCDYKVEQEVVPALNHKDTLVEVDAKAPTCTEIGWDAYEYCTACDYTTCVEIPALTHTDANCDYKCDYNCGYEYETLDFSDAKVLSSDADGYLCIDGVKIDEDSARSAQYLPTGKYKLEGDIISNDCIIWILAEEQVIINLNGYKWTLGDSITLDGELSLYDLSEDETGKIVASTNLGNVNMQEEGSVLNLYSGTLESTGGCALRFQKGNANLYGGKLKSDKYVIRNNVAKGNKGIDIDGTVLECGDGYAQILCSSTSNSVTESFIDVSDYTGDYLTVQLEVKKSGKYTIFEGIKNAQEADKYSIDVKYEERHEIFFDKTEYDEATGEKCVYIKSNAFVQQPSPENNYTVGFSNPDASFQWYEVEETSSRVHTAVNDMTIYTNNFKAGDILKVSTDSEIRRVILYSDYGSLDLDEDTKTAMIKFDTDVMVGFVPAVLDAENPVELEFSIINETLLDGATGKTLKNPEFRKEYYCKATVGKFVYTSDIVAGHYIVRVDAKAPTCTEICWDAYIYCIDCNYTSYVEKEALNHKDTLVKVDAKAPTCTEIGWDAYEYCTACNYTTYVELPVSGHTASPTYAPTADGSQHVATYSCCGYESNENHTPAEDAIYTDNGDGTHSFTCSGCNETVPEKHVFGSDNICICGAKIEFTGVEVSNQNDLIDKGNGNYIAAVAPGAPGTDITFKYVGKNLEYLTADNTLLKTHCDNSTLGECEDPLEVMIETDFTGKVMNWKDGAWWEWEYSNDGGITWEGVHVDVKQGYTITNATTDTNGSVVVPEYHVADETVVLTVTPADGYILATLTVTDAEGNLVTVENNSFTMPASAVTVNATFVVCDHTGGEATCSVQAVCENCGTSYFDANKHTLVQVDAKAPTCTEIGWEAYEYCTACDYTTYVEKEALNHKDTLVKVDAKAPTCTEIGWDAYEYCTACTYTTYVELPADPDAHTPLEAVTENEVAPKCDVTGSYDLVVYCDDCGAELDRDTKTVDALKHSFTKYEVTEEAKCGIEGKEVATCDNGCGEIDEKAIEALNHSFTKYEVTEEAKCGVEGKEVAYCDNGCGETDEKAIEALRHSFTKYEVTEEAKCDIEGKEVAACDNGCAETDEKAIEALTHTDADGDYICDNGCGHEFEKPAPEEPDTPDTPDEPTDDACDHLCHKGGFVGFIWKIVKFFSKLFKINPTCECGVAHY